MPPITAADVKKLRDQTGAGMMECKAALAEASGNIDEATTLLRKRGLAQAAKAGDADRFKNAPRFAPRRRLDETRAAREPRLRWVPAAGHEEAAE